MKLQVVVLIIIAFCPSSAVTEDDPLSQFRGVTLGTKYEDIKSDLVVKGSLSKPDKYGLTKCQLGFDKIGEIEIQSGYVTFFEGQLYMVQFWLEWDDRKVFEQAAIKKYGPPIDSRDTATNRDNFDRYALTWESTAGRIHFTIQEDPRIPLGSLFSITSKDILQKFHVVRERVWREEERQDSIKAAEAADDF